MLLAIQEPDALRFGELRELLAEYIEGGVVITDPLSGVDQVDGDQVAFRTLVQLDGDICVSIHAEALAAPDFPAAHAQHLAHVRAELARHTRALRRWSRLPAWGSGMLGFGLMYGFDPLGDYSGVLLDGVWQQLVVLAAATVGGALISVLGRATARRLLRRVTAT